MKTSDGKESSTKYFSLFLMALIEFNWAERFEEAISSKVYTPVGAVLLASGEHINETF